MPPRRKTTPALPRLSDADVSALKSRVSAGEKPRVVVRTASASVPAGTRGNIIRIGNPSEGEYIVVRLGRDEVPFAPSELALTTRGKAAAPAKTATKASGKAATSKSTASTRSAPAKSTAKKAAPRPAAAKKAAARPAAAAAATTGSTRARRATARRSRKGRSPQPLTVTLRFTDGRWSVEAQRGSRRVAKATPLRPGAVSAFAEHVEEQAVRDALIETVESCRAVVEERAASLRSELSAAEEALREYDARRR